jgi:hypothetical protein
MDPMDSNEKSALHLVNPIGQQGQTSPNLARFQPVYDRKQAMKHLAEMAMPVDARTLMVNVDEAIASALQTINDSLTLSSQHIDFARQRLMQAHPSLKQAYESEMPSLPSAASETPVDSVPTAAMDEFSQHLLSELDKDSKDYQNKVLLTHDTQQQQAMAKQEAINSAAENMQQQLLAQQQAYQQHLLSKTSHAPAPVADPKTEQQSQHGQEATSQTEDQSKEPPRASGQSASASLKCADEEQLK